MRRPSVRLAKLHAAGRKADAYLYNFTLEFPVQHQKIAWHCSDIPFFFHNTDLVEVCQIPEAGGRLERQMTDAFLSFARNGRPECDSLPDWTPVTPDTAPTMIFDRTCELRTDYDDRLYEKIDSILPPFNLMEMMANAENAVQH